MDQVLTQTRLTNNAWNEGLEAYREGITIGSCPYLPYHLSVGDTNEREAQSANYHAWCNGWWWGSYQARH